MAPLRPVPGPFRRRPRLPVIVGVLFLLLAAACAVWLFMQL
jgi:hypothetical protein